MKQTDEMGSMPIPKLAFKISIPMVISMISIALYGIVDTMFISKIGDEALTAAALSIPIQSIITAIALGTSIGLNALLAKTYEPEVIDRLMKSLDEVTDAQGIKSALSETEDLSFVDAVRLLIGQSGRTEAEVYKAAGLDRRLFSKIMNDPSYKPSKDTAVCLALALRLPLSQANDLLSRAGYTLSHSIRRDIVIEYFFRKRVYDLMTVNLTLDRLTLRTLGR